MRLETIPLRSFSYIRQASIERIAKGYDNVFNVINHLAPIAPFRTFIMTAVGEIIQLDKTIGKQGFVEIDFHAEYLEINGLQKVLVRIEDITIPIIMRIANYDILGKSIVIEGDPHVYTNKDKNILKIQFQVLRLKQLKGNLNLPFTERSLPNGR